MIDKEHHRAVLKGLLLCAFNLLFFPLIYLLSYAHHTDSLLAPLELNEMKDSSSKDGRDHHRNSRSKQKSRSEKGNDRYEYGKPDYKGEFIAVHSRSSNLIKMKGSSSKDVTERCRYTEPRHDSGLERRPDPYKKITSVSNSESKLVGVFPDAHHELADKARRSTKEQTKEVIEVTVEESTDDEEYLERGPKERRRDYHRRRPPSYPCRDDPESDTGDPLNNRQHVRPKARSSRHNDTLLRSPVSGTPNWADTSSDESSPSLDDCMPNISKIRPRKDLHDELNGIELTGRLSDTDFDEGMQGFLRDNPKDKWPHKTKHKAQTPRAIELRSDNVKQFRVVETTTWSRYPATHDKKFTYPQEVRNSTERPSIARSQRHSSPSTKSRRPKAHNRSNTPSSPECSPYFDKLKELEAYIRSSKRSPELWRPGYETYYPAHFNTRVYTVPDQFRYKATPDLPNSGYKIDPLPRRTTDQPKSNYSSSNPRVEEKEADYYDILGIESCAVESEIRQAFRKKSMGAHPDRVKDEDKLKANEEMATLNEARDTLLDSLKRSRYDRERLLRADLRKL